MTEPARDALVKGDSSEARRLLDRAEALDDTAVKEVVAAMDEGAADGSD